MRTRRTLRGHLAKIYAMHWASDSRFVSILDKIYAMYWASDSRFVSILAKIYAMNWAPDSRFVSILVKTYAMHRVINSWYVSILLTITHQNIRHALSLRLNACVNTCQDIRYHLTKRCIIYWVWL